MKPSDNLRHQLLKYLEDRANRTSSTTIPAPPPYTTNPSTSTSIPNTLRIPIMYVPNNTYYDEDYDWEEPSPTTISITIDFSITITGDKNTVTMSSPQVDSPASDTTNSSIETTNANANTKGLGYSPEQMDQLAATIINALKSQGLTEEKGRKRPITLALKRGIVIKGIDNKVCIGNPSPRPPARSIYDDDSDGDTIRSASTVSRRTCSVRIQRFIYSIPRCIIKMLT